ncbi:hypothetical protein AB0J21_02665 [Streptomyces sp. NPDC049954]|uniref:hypothetical protein n=1 Tax=Streptomyces sp. NPDC049954 TaxID=3155779 RepID=UPI00343075E2
MPPTSRATSPATGDGADGARRPGPSRRSLLGAAAGTAAALAVGAAAPAWAGPRSAARAAGPLDLGSTADAVGINYTVLHNLAVGPGKQIYDNTEILHTTETTGQPPAWGPLNANHFWGRPASGYSRSDDTAVLRTHAQQLSDARIDFIVVDATNVQGPPDAGSDEIYYAPTRVLLDTWKEIRASGGSTPAVVPWVGTPASNPDPAACGNATWDEFYASGAYEDLFVTYEGKPLLVTTDTLPDALRERFTLRKMWGLQQQLADQEWSFLQDYPQNVGMSGGAPEQIAVCTALQHTYMTEPDAVGRLGGRTFRDQWRQAFQVRPKVTILTWWNEWTAQRFEDEAGNTRFVDNYDEPLSRDIEPQDPAQVGSHGDLYYQWTKQYVAAYKDHAAFPEDLVQ